MGNLRKQGMAVFDRPIHSLRGLDLCRTCDCRFRDILILARQTMDGYLDLAFDRTAFLVGRTFGVLRDSGVFASDDNYIFDG